MSWTSGEDVVTRRSYETDVSFREAKFKSSTDVHLKTNTNMYVTHGTPSRASEAWYTGAG